MGQEARCSRRNQIVGQEARGRRNQIMGQEARCSSSNQIVGQEANVLGGTR